MNPFLLREALNVILKSSMAKDAVGGGEEERLLSICPCPQHILRGMHCFLSQAVEGVEAGGKEAMIPSTPCARNLSCLSLEATCLLEPSLCSL